MRNARTRRSVRRPSRFGLHVVTITILLAWLGTTHPTPAVAQIALDCSTNGFCVSGSIDRLLGLPNGTLRFGDPVKPWDVVVKGPAAVSWAPVEADARAALAALHGVPNDKRLPYAAIDEIRGFMFMRLLELAQRRSLNSPSNPVSPAEMEAVEMFHQLVKNRRVRAAQNATAEYKRWQTDPCHYTVPAGFGFDEYDPGPGCGLAGQILFGPPSPPTAEQLMSYGSALTRKEFDDALRAAKKKALGIDDSQSTFTYDPTADMAAAFRNAEEGFSIAAGISLTVAVLTATAIAATASAGIAGGFAALSGSYSVFGIAAAASGAVVTGIGVALAVPAIIIFCIVFSVIRGIQVSDDYAVPTKLQEALAAAYATPDPWTVASTDAGQVELFSIFIDQTLPSYDEQRAADLAPPPAQRLPGDPQFEVVTGSVGVRQNTIETLGRSGRQQQTFMSQGWFVTRDRQSDGNWGPPRWRLNLRYLQNSGDPSEHSIGIQPSTFVHTFTHPTTFTPESARRVSEFTAATTSGSRTIRWAGNRAPVIKATSSQHPRIGEQVTFNAVVTDPDGDGISRVRWYFDTGNTGSPFYQTSLAECSFRPAGRVDAAGNVFLCPWSQVDGTSSSITYTVPGTYSVMVMAEDSEGAISSEMFSISVDAFQPELTLTQLGFLTLPGPGSFPGILEGQPITVAGTLNYPVNPSGNYSELTRLVIDWGDGQVTQKMYPCKADGDPTVLSDALCIFNFTTREHVEWNSGPVPGSPNLPRGPWPFSFSHTYAYSPERPLHPLAAGTAQTANDGQARVKVYAVTTRGSWSPVHRLDFTIRNTPPVLEMRGVCPVVPSGGTSCSGDRREVAVGQPLTLSGRVFDILGASHLITVLWGDGTSSELPPGCTDAGCPSFNGWPETPVVPFQFPKYFNLKHTYPSVGTYPITVIVNDGGPNGRVSLPASPAVIFGVSPLTGPAEIPAGELATYDFTSRLPAGGALAVTPTCEGGQLTGQTASSFTCRFDDVSAKTRRKASLQAVIAGTTFDRSFDVDVLPALVKMSNLSGPTSVIGGMTRTYTYTSSHSGFTTATFTPSCGAGSIVEKVEGSSFTCLFDDLVAAPIFVSVSALDSLGNTADIGLAVNLEPDLAPPVLTLPTEVKINSTSNAGAIASFIVSAMDNVSGQVSVTCNAASGSLYPIGTTTVSCQAKDWKGLTGVGAFPIRIVDVTLPSLTVPGSQELNATSPAGAVATFVATAVDTGPLTPTCTPASGSTFAVGTTTVSCSVADAAGNTTTGTFTIKVVGPADQIAALQRWVEKQSMNATLQKQLVSAFKKAGAAAASGDSQATCKQLANIVSLVTSSTLTNAQKNKLLNDVARISGVVGC